MIVKPCPVCQVRRGPCVEDGRPIDQYHVARVRALSASTVGDYATEATRLRKGAS